MVDYNCGVGGRIIVNNYILQVFTRFDFFKFRVLIPEGLFQAGNCG